MVLTKVKIATVVLLLLGLAGSAGVVMIPTLLAEQTEGQYAPTSTSNREAEKPSKGNSSRDKESIQGIWTLQKIETGRRDLKVEPGSVELVVTNEFLIWKEGGKDRAFNYKLAPEKTPKQIDLISLSDGPDKGAVSHGIYQVDDTLIICEGDGKRPLEFSTKAGLGDRLFIYRRANAIPKRTEKAAEQAPKKDGNKIGLEVFTFKEREIEIPVKVDTAMDLKQLHLFISDDEGGTWRKVATISPVDDAFHFTAMKDGLYWLTVQFVKKDGTKQPTAREFRPTMKILVKAGPKEGLNWSFWSGKFQ